MLCCACCAGIQDVVDVHIFMGARRVVEALRQHDCSEALAWCEENRAKLRKSKSKLEFRLRVQVSYREVHSEAVVGRLGLKA